MPVSEMRNIPAIMKEVVRLQPRNILELGIGGGKYGVLCREALDWVHGRFPYSSDAVYINGVEGFEKYRNPAWDLYDDVEIGDFSLSENYLRYFDYDLVLLIDSLEHIEKPVGLDLVRWLLEKNKHVIISCPDGNYPQGAVFGNEYERHRATWTRDDLRALGGREIFHDVCTVVSIAGVKRSRATA